MQKNVNVNSSLENRLELLRKAIDLGEILPLISMVLPSLIFHLLQSNTLKKNITAFPHCYCPTVTVHIRSFSLSIHQTTCLAIMTAVFVVTITIPADPRATRQSSNQMNLPEDEDQQQAPAQTNTDIEGNTPAALASPDHLPSQQQSPATNGNNHLDEPGDHQSGFGSDRRGNGRPGASSDDPSRHSKRRNRTSSRRTSHTPSFRKRTWPAVFHNDDDNIDVAGPGHQPQPLREGTPAAPPAAVDPSFFRQHHQSGDSGAASSTLGGQQVQHQAAAPAPPQLGTRFGRPSQPPPAPSNPSPFRSRHQRPRLIPESYWQEQLEYNDEWQSESNADDWDLQERGRSAVRSHATTSHAPSEN